MSKLFRGVAIAFLIISALILFMGIFSIGDAGSLLLALSGFCGVVVALALRTVGDLLDRVSYLEDKLNMHLPVNTDDELPQVKCKKCGKEYDMDYPKCPYCDAQTEFDS